MTGVSSQGAGTGSRGAVVGGRAAWALGLVMLTPDCWLLTPAHAADWPQFRGPGGVPTAEAALPTKWSATENLRWKADLPGRGLSAPVTAGDRLYVTACTGGQGQRLVTLAFDPATGRELWRRQLFATGNLLCHPTTNMAAPTPVADAAGVYALFATADLAAYDRDGNLRWYRSLTGDYPTITNSVGMASSPVLVGGTLVVPMENAGESFLAGIDARDGRNLWKVERPRESNWTSPVARPLPGGGAEVLFCGRTELVAYDPATGQKRWSYSGENLSTIPSPTLAGDRVLVNARGEIHALKVTDGQSTPEVVWKAAKLPSAFASPLFADGKVYAVTNAGVLVCVDGSTGKELWRERVKGPVSASLVAAGGHVYVVGEKGQTVVVKPGEKPTVVATNDLADTLQATPALGDGVIYLRSDKFLYCVGK